MYYTVKELRRILADKLFELGIDPQFRDNPAYASYIREIDTLIGQMNMFGEVNRVYVRESQRRISLSWNSPVGKKYSMAISSDSPDTIRCVCIEEKGLNVNHIQNNQEKVVVEKVATIDIGSGYLTIVTNGSIVDNVDCVVGKCNNYPWAERKKYDSNWIMVEKEYLGFARGELTEKIDNVNVNTILYIPRQASNYAHWRDNYQTKMLMVRDKLDTALVISENKVMGTRYVATIPLNQEHGLRDMFLPNGDPFPGDIVISPISEEEIESMIQKENNLKVAEGLRCYATDREDYSYRSDTDKYFIKEGFGQFRTKR